MQSPQRINLKITAMFAELGAIGKKCTGYEPTNQTGSPGPMTVDWAYYHRGCVTNLIPRMFDAAAAPAFT